MSGYSWWPPKRGNWFVQLVAKWKAWRAERERIHREYFDKTH